MNMSRCDENANCTNTDGSHNCSCHHGYEGDGFNCTGNKNHILDQLHFKRTIPEFYAFSFD